MSYKLMTEGIPLTNESVNVVWRLGGMKGKTLDRTCYEIRRVLKTGGLLFLVENTARKPDAPHWNFRSAAAYQALFTDIPVKTLHDYCDLGEPISIMAGRKS